MTPTDDLEHGMAFVVHTAWVSPFTTKSDFARAMADLIAAAASRGLLTTHLGGHEYSRYWHPTPEGLLFVRFHLPETST